MFQSFSHWLVSSRLCRVQAEVQIGITRKYTSPKPLLTFDTTLCSSNIGYNDVAGNFSVTLIDALDTFVVLNDTIGFEQAVRNTIRWVSFNVNTKPQVFESTIRVMGGLLSAHMFANQTGQPFYLPWYRDELLSMAHDLGNRLLPAFSTPTGIPYARVCTKEELLRTNLTHCVVESPSWCHEGRNN